MNETERDAFAQELAARIALHEVLLEKLFATLLGGDPMAHERLATLGDAVVHVMGSLHPNLSEGAEDWQVHWAQAQRSRGQELARCFVAKVARNI